MWAYDGAGVDRDTGLLTGVDNLTAPAPGISYIAEDSGDTEINVINPRGAVTPFLRIDDQPSSEISGPALSPDGRRLHFSSQHWTGGLPPTGIAYEGVGPPLRSPAR